MFKLSKKLWTSAALASALCSTSAFAAQSIEGCYTRHVELAASSTEQSMLTVAGRRISALAPSKPGVLEYRHEETLNAVYFAFVDGHKTGTVTLFVTDDQGETCTLILSPRAIAGDKITVVPPTKKVTRSAAKAQPYQQRVKALLLVMAGANPDSPVPVQGVNADVPLWEGTRLVFKRRYLDDALVGEVYDLTNVGTTDMQLAEQELYRQGVVAVAIAEHTLPVGASTTIYVVRSRGENE